MFAEINFLFHTAIVFALTGIMWFVQLIHYPILKDLPKKEVQKFESLHIKKTLAVATILLSLELLTALILLFNIPDQIHAGILSISLFFLLGIWIATWGYCVPSHYTLKNKGAQKALVLLMRANLSRTILYSIRSILLFVLLMQFI